LMGFTWFSVIFIFSNVQISKLFRFSMFWTMVIIAYSTRYSIFFESKTYIRSHQIQ
jgi:hypothetical protein